MGTSGGFRINRDAPVLLFLTIVVLVACQPINAVDLWWELASGREVLSGHLAPSRSLLADEVLADADWLSGVPILLAYQAAGASGLMTMRLVAAVAIASIFWSRLSGSRWWRLLFVGGLLLTVSPALDPSALLWDLVALVCLGLLVSRWHPGHPWRVVAAIACLMTLWANLGPRPLVGLLALTAWAVPRARSHWGQTWWQLAALLSIATAACLLTPRGFATLVDSARLTFPAWTQQGAWLLEGPWQPALSHFPRPHALGFLLVTSMVIACAAMGASRGEAWAGRGWIWGLAVAQLLAWQNLGNMALAGLVMAMIPGHGGDVTEPSAPDPTRGGTSSGSSRWWRYGRGFSWSMAIVVLASAVAAQAAGGIGWGIAQRLDVRFLDRALASKRLEGKALGDKLTTVGMLAWGGRGLLVHDAPHRALLGGRLDEMQLLLKDLEFGNRAAYERIDGSQGGWWLPLIGDDTVLLLVSTENTALIEGLAPTLWRPLAIDGPVIPFAQAGSAPLTPRIVEVIQQQDFVETGGWDYSPPPTTHSEYDRDWWGLRSVVDDTAVAKGQAGLFRAMGLPRAALSVLRHLQQTGRSELVSDLAQAVHAELMQEETRLAGRPSRFRQLACGALASGANVGEGDDRLARAAAAYAAGDLSGALQTLGQAPSPESRYGRAVILLESGRREESLRELVGLASEFPDAAVGIWAQALLERIALTAESERPRRAERKE